MPLKTSTIDTSHGRIAMRESAGTGMPVLLIHGNSSSSAVFANQMEGELGAAYRMIAPDLPGHGASDNAPDPERSYSMHGYALAMTEVLERLGVEKAAVLGWSLGGHIGLEMIAMYPGMLGLMITGTPPVAPADAGRGFRPSPHMGLAGKEEFTDEDVELYARNTCGEPLSDELRAAVARTDGRARALMIARFLSGVDRDQDKIVAGPTPTIAVVNGADEPFVDVDFLDGVAFSNLWEGKKHLIEKSGHAPFWDSPDRFDPYLKRFLESVSPAA